MRSFRYLGEDRGGTGTEFFREDTSGFERASEIDVVYCRSHPGHELAELACANNTANQLELGRYFTYNPSVYTSTGRVNHREGRVVVWKGAQFHSPFSDTPQDLSCDPRKGRLALTLFIGSRLYPTIGGGGDDDVLRSMSVDATDSTLAADASKFARAHRAFAGLTELNPKVAASDSAALSSTPPTPSPGFKLNPYQQYAAARTATHVRDRRGGGKCAGDPKLCCSKNEGKGGYYCASWGAHKERCGTYHRCAAAIGMLLDSCCIDNRYPAHTCGIKTQCPSCSSGQYRSSSCSGTSAGTCSTCPACSTGSWRSGCGGTSAGSCSACKTDCGGGNYRSGCGALSHVACGGRCGQACHHRVVGRLAITE